MYGIIAGAICFLALIIVITAIVCAKKRRSRSEGMFPSGLSSGGSRGGARGARPPFIVGKRRINHRRKKSRQGKQDKTAPHPPPSLAQGLNPPLLS